MNDTVNLSSLLNATVEEIKANGRVILIYLAIMVGVTGGLAAGVGATAFTFDLWGASGGDSLAAQSAFAIVAGLGFFVVYVVAQYWLLAGMVHRSTSPGFDALLPYIGIYILMGIAILFGLLLFIVPGIMLAVRWLTLLPTVIARDGPAMESFGVSSDMSEGRGWSIFGAYVILVILSLVLSSITAGVGMIFGAIAMAVLDAANSALSAIVFAALSVGAYRLMRDDKDELTEVFE